MAKWAGFSNIGEKVVIHQARKYGVTKFGLERFVNGFLDLMTITFISRFGKKPMHLFGVIGTIMFFLGFGLFTYIGGYKLYAMFNSIKAKILQICLDSILHLPLWLLVYSYSYLVL